MQKLKKWRKKWNCLCITWGICTYARNDIVHFRFCHYYTLSKRFTSIYRMNKTPVDFKFTMKWYRIQLTYKSCIIGQAVALKLIFIQGIFPMYQGLFAIHSTLYRATSGVTPCSSNSKCLFIIYLRSFNISIFVKNYSAK